MNNQPEFYVKGKVDGKRTTKYYTMTYNDIDWAQATYDRMKTCTMYLIKNEKKTILQKK